MHRIFNFFLRFREYFVLFLTISISLALISQNNNIQIKQIRSSSVQILGFLQENFSSVFNTIWIPHILSISKENRLLREHNLILSEEVSRLREASLENLRLRALLNFKQQSKFDLRSSKIVGKSLTLARNFITLDLGSDDGIQVNMPIVTDKGLVGKIVMVSKNYSQGQILKNKDFKASAIDERSRVSGIFAWDGEDFIVEEVAKNHDIKLGDLIITSDYSSIFPSKIPIGIVSNISYNTGNLFQRIQIKSNVDLNTLEEVFILIYPPDSNRVAFDNNIIKKD
jgi:rod shape-determining protein MreC